MTMLASVALNRFLPDHAGSIASVMLLMFTTSAPTPRNCMCRMMLGVQVSYTVATILCGGVQNHGKAVAFGYILGYLGIFCGDELSIYLV